MAWNYSNTSLQTTLVGGVTASATSIQVASASGLPVSFPYSLAIDYGLSTVEVVTVTGASGTTLTVVRGEDGTAGQSHTNGATVVHGVVARDLREPQQHIEATQNVHGVGPGADVVGTTTTQTLANKTISGASNTIQNIPNSALAAIDAAKVTQPFGALAATGNATVGGTLGVTGATSLAAATATSLTATGTVQGATVTATGAVNGASAAVSGNATVGGTLAVTGTTALTGAATLAGGVAGTVTATGVVSGSDVQVAGASMPRGKIGSAALTSQLDTDTTEVVVASITFTAIANRRYKLTWNGGVKGTTAGDYAWFQMKYSPGVTLIPATGTSIRALGASISVANMAIPFTMIAENKDIPAGQRTIGITMKRYIGTGTVSADAFAGLSEGLLLLEDMGT